MIVKGPCGALADNRVFLLDYKGDTLYHIPISDQDRHKHIEAFRENPEYWTHEPTKQEGVTMFITLEQARRDRTMAELDEMIKTTQLEIKMAHEELRKGVLKCLYHKE